MTSTVAGVVDAAKGLVDLGLEHRRVGVVHRRQPLDHHHAGHGHGPVVVTEGLPAGGAGDLAEDVAVGAGRPPGPVEDGEPHGHTDPLFDPDEGHRGQGHDGEAEFPLVEPEHRHQLAHVEEARGHEDEDGGQRGQGHVAEQARGGDDEDDGRRQPPDRPVGSGLPPRPPPRSGPGWRWRRMPPPTRPGCCRPLHRRSPGSRRRRIHLGLRRRVWWRPSDSARPVPPRPRWAAPGPVTTTTDP